MQGGKPLGGSQLGGQERGGQITLSILKIQGGKGGKGFSTSCQGSWGERIKKGRFAEVYESSRHCSSNLTGREGGVSLLNS